MNRDTPGAVPSDDFPFLGPAISPRRREAGAPLQDTDELAGPFVGGMFGSAAEEAAPAPATDAGASASAPAERFEEAFEEAAAPAGAEEALGELPSADWATDEFPWLIPDESTGGAGEPETPWRATGEVEEVTQREPAAGAEEAPGVDHYSWIGEGLPEEDVGEPWATGTAAPAEAGEGADAVGWNEAAAEAAEEAPAAPEHAGFDAGDEGWGGAVEWTGGGAAGVDRGAPEAEGEPEYSVEGFAWEEGADEGEPATAARWGADEEFRVGGEAASEAVVEEPAPETGFAEVASAAAAEPPVEAAPLPVGEWEAAPDDGEVEAEPTAVGWTGGAVDPLQEVADRLERIARSLRSGKPIEAVEEGDPLQLLITGYALGYSQARRARS